MKYTTESQRLVVDGRGPLLAPLLAVVDRRWPALACMALVGPFAGCCGPSLACVGLLWPALACVGLHWPSLAVVGLCWPALAVLRWPSLPSLAFVGLRWPSRPDYYLNTYKISLVKTINQKNRTYLGPNDATRRLGPHHPVVGLPWPSLACVGCRGSSLSRVSLRWPALACRGSSGLLSHVSPRWASLACVGLRWPALACIGCVGCRETSLACVGPS
jgi:hypothetical protein